MSAELQKVTAILKEVDFVGPTLFSKRGQVQAALSHTRRAGEEPTRRSRVENSENENTEKDSVSSYSRPKSTPVFKSLTDMKRTTTRENAWGYKPDSTPAVGKYTPIYTRLDTQAYTAQLLPSFGGSLHPEKDGGSKSPEKSTRTVEDTKSSPTRRDFNRSSSVSADGPKTTRTRLDAEGHVKMLSSSLLEKEKPSPPFGTTDVRMNGAIQKGDVETDYYISHDSNLEVSSKKPRIPLLPLPRASLGSTASVREAISSVDKIYNTDTTKQIGASQHTLANFSKETSRETNRGGGGLFQTKSNGGGIYLPRDDMLSKRKRVTNCYISPNNGYFGKPMVVYNSSVSDKTSDVVAADAKVRPRMCSTVPFGKPTTSPYLTGLAQRERKRKQKEAAEQSWREGGGDVEGYVVPDYYDVGNLDKIKERHYKQVPQEMAPGRPGVFVPLTANLDYLPDLTSGLMPVKGAKLVTKKDGSIGPEGAPPTARTLIESYRRLSPHGGATEVPLPQSLTMSTILRPATPDTAVISAGMRRHIPTLSFDSAPTREQVDPSRFHDKPLGYFFDTKSAEMKRAHTHNVTTVRFGKVPGRARPPIIHGLNRFPANDLIYDANYSYVDKDPTLRDFSGNKKMSPVEVDWHFKKNPNDIPFYDTNLKWVKPSIPKPLIRPTTVMTTNDGS